MKLFAVMQELADAQITTLWVFLDVGPVSQSQFPQGKSGQ